MPDPEAALKPWVELDETWLPVGGKKRPVAVVLGPKDEQLDLRLSGPGFDWGDWFTDLEERDGQGLNDQRCPGIRPGPAGHPAKGNHHKADNIQRYNLGRNKWNQRKRRHRKQTRNHLCHAAHAVVDKANTIACEDLTAPMKSAQYRHRDTNRHLNGWVKGVMADTLTSISRRRGSALALVNPACTSQIDSWTG